MGDMTEANARAALLTTGRRASESLARSVTDKPTEAAVETNVGSLRGLAGVLEALVDDAERCGGLDCMGRSVDGTKLWVTRDRFEEVERRAARLESSLRAIADAVDASGGELDMLIDWQGTARALSEAARRALDDVKAV